MNDSELNHLVKMVNQISDNLDHNDSMEVVSERVADHLSRFWASSMREKIIKYAGAGGGDLKASAKLAIEKLVIRSN